MFRIYLKSRAEKQFAKLPGDWQRRFCHEFDRLSVNPFSHPQVKKLKGAECGYRLRVGRRRILFALFSKEKVIEIVDIFLKKGRDDYWKRRHLL